MNTPFQGGAPALTPVTGGHITMMYGNATEIAPSVKAGKIRALGREQDFENDPRYRSMTTRTQNIGAIYRELGDLLRSRSTAEWLDLFNRADIPAIRLHTLESLLADEHLAATGFFGEEEHPSEGRLRTMAYPSRWSETPPQGRRPVPRLGEHSVEVLREIGYDDQRIEVLLRSGATSVPPEVQS